MTDFIDMERFRAGSRAGEPAATLLPPRGIIRAGLGQPKAYDDGSRKIRFCFSDATVDRMGDTIQADGWELDQFAKNAVALWAHDSSQPPIGRASNLAVEEGRLMGDIEFMTPDLSPFADSVYRMVLAGFLNAVSVGFMPKEYSFVEDKDRPWGMDFKRQELLEISVCPVPANPNALIDAKAAGIDVRLITEWAEKMMAKSAAPHTAPSKTRRSSRRRDAGDAIGETSPSDGGALLGTCGRAMDQECGLIDPTECQVHGQAPEDDSTKLLDELAQLLAQLTDGLEKRKMKTQPRRREAAQSSEGEGSDKSHEECVRMAAVHFKAADALYDAGDEHYSKAMDHLEAAVDTLDGEASGNPEGEGGGEEEEGKALKRARDLLSRAKVAAGKAASAK